jgi:hypothetical protein
MLSLERLNFRYQPYLRSDTRSWDAQWPPCKGYIAQEEGKALGGLFPPLEKKDLHFDLKSSEPTSCDSCPYFMFPLSCGRRYSFFHIFIYLSTLQCFSRNRHLMHFDLAKSFENLLCAMY